MITFTDIASYTYNSDKHNSLPLSVAYNSFEYNSLCFMTFILSVTLDILSSV
jgi:hypothetical protein